VRGLLASLVLSAGCNYPDFAFVAGDAAEAADAATDSSVDSAELDSAPLEETGEDSTIDSAADSRGDTAIDSTKPDVATDAPPPVGCVGAHVFCDDFDTSSKPESDWLPLYSAGGGTMVFDGSGVCRSCPHSPISTVPSSASADAAPELAAQLVKTFDATTSSKPMRLDFWVRLDAAFTGSTMMLAKLQRGTSGRGVEVDLAPDGIYLGVLGSGSSKYLSTKKLPALGKFVHVRLEATLAVGTEGSGRVFVDDMTAPAAELVGLSTTDTTSVTTKVIVGLYTNETNPTSYRAYYDDVSFDWL
jgi:hypothetical protein